MRAVATASKSSSNKSADTSSVIGTSGGIWFADEPDPDDYRHGKESPAFQAAKARYEIAQASDKSACAECPVRGKCLANSLSIGVSSNVCGPEYESISGGWGPGARYKIHERFDKMRRAFEGVVYKRGDGLNRMPPDEIADLLRDAGIDPANLDVLVESRKQISGGRIS